MSRGWMPLYVGDYLADTGHLNMAEHGAYMLLIMHYWQKGSLPNDDAKLAGIVRGTPKQWASVKPAIAEFFDENWRHKRIDQELAKANEISSKRKANAEVRWSNRNANALQEQCKSNANDMHRGRAGAREQSQSQSHISSLRSDSTQQAKCKSNANASKNKRTSLVILSTVLSEKTALDLIDHRKRKKAPLSARAAEGLVKRFIEHGNAEEAAEAMIVNGWRGFEPSWMTNQARAGPGPRPNGSAEAIRNFFHKWDPNGDET